MISALLLDNGIIAMMCYRWVPPTRVGTCVCHLVLCCGMRRLQLHQKGNETISLGIPVGKTNYGRDPGLLGAQSLRSTKHCKRVTEKLRHLLCRVRQRPSRGDIPAEDNAPRLRQGRKVRWIQSCGSWWDACVWRMAEFIVHTVHTQQCMSEVVGDLVEGILRGTIMRRYAFRGNKYRIHYT